MEQQLELLNQKFDKMILLLENNLNVNNVKSVKNVKNVKKQIESDEEEWSVEHYKNSILVKFSFNHAFKDKVKNLGGIWMVSKKAWMFPKSNEKEIIKDIMDSFDTWILTDLREYIN